MEFSETHGELKQGRKCSRKSSLKESDSVGWQRLQLV